MRVLLDCRFNYAPGEYIAVINTGGTRNFPCRLRWSTPVSCGCEGANSARLKKF